MNAKLLAILQAIKNGDVLFLRVLASWKNKADHSQGKKVRMEIAEIINNPLRNSSSFAGDMNEGDERFNVSRPRRFYGTAEFPKFVERLGHLFTKEQLTQVEQLEPVTGLGSEDNWVEGRHFIWVNQINPKSNEGLPLAGRIIESTVQRNTGQKHKIYPTTLANGQPSPSPFAGKSITSNGLKIYSTNDIQYCIPDGKGGYTKPISTFLPVDPQQVPQGLTVEEARAQSQGKRQLESADAQPDDEGAAAMNVRGSRQGG